VPPLTALGVGILAGLCLGLSTPALLRLLPEPADPPADKVPYADLATAGFAGTVGAAGAVAVGLAALTIPVAALPLWLVLGTVAVLLAAIDARTTWLPRPLTQAAWIATGVAALLGAALGGGEPLLRSIAGFLLAGALFGLVWLATRGGFGFGDVRFAPLVGAATAAVSWTLLAWALVLGSLVGALVGVVRLVARRPGAFAYAPAILAGAYLAAIVSWLST
jgi:leader peptidase (prepilin peptidase) / N-methyltransferase